MCLPICARDTAPFPGQRQKSRSSQDLPQIPSSVQDALSSFFSYLLPSPICDLKASDSPPCAQTAHASCFFQSRMCCSNWVFKSPPYSLNTPAITFVRIVSLDKAGCPECCAGVHTGPRQSRHEATKPWMEDWASLVFC